MTSAFDPVAFLDAQQSEVNEKRPPLPEENPAADDGLYVATIGELKAPRSGTIGKGDRAGEPWIQVVIPLKIDVPQQLRDSMKLPPSLTISDGAFIDLTPAGSIDNSPGKNRRQRDYREALDMNKPGEPFSWRSTEGRIVKVKIKHELFEGTVQERIAAVLRA